VSIPFRSGRPSQGDGRFRRGNSSGGCQSPSDRGVLHRSSRGGSEMAGETVCQSPSDRGVLHSLQMKGVAAISFFMCQSPSDRGVLHSLGGDPSP